MSDQTRFLLDKVTARRILEGLLKLAEARDLTAEEVIALDLYERAGSHGLRQFMVPSTESVLGRLGDRPRYTAIIHLFPQHVEVAFPTRYFKRWARRLQGYGFTPRRRWGVSPGHLWYRSGCQDIGHACCGHI
jgi:hypothetical protein